MRKITGALFSKLNVVYCVKKWFGFPWLFAFLWTQGKGDKGVNCLRTYHRDSPHRHMQLFWLARRTQAHTTINGLRAPTMEPLQSLVSLLYKECTPTEIL